jgi:hypothetical protein
MGQGRCGLRTITALPNLLIIASRVAPRDLLRWYAPECVFALVYDQALGMAVSMRIRDAASRSSELA